MSEHDHNQNEFGSSHGSVGSYIVGFIISVVLTLSAFGAVAYKIFPTTGLIITISVLAVIQLLVQLVFFLHLDTSSSSRWNLMAFLFTLLVVVVLVFGSLWIMLSLNYNMMTDI